MPFSPRPKTAEQYVGLVDQAIVELDELRSCIEFDMDDPGDALRLLEPLDEGLRRLRSSMADGSYVFENRDLPFMEIANRYRSQLPFVELLVTINQTHREGLDISGD